MYEVIQCGGMGLADALADAAATVKEMGERAIISIAVMPNVDVPDTWWVPITYRPDWAEGGYYRRSTQQG